MCCNLNKVYISTTQCTNILKLYIILKLYSDYISTLHKQAVLYNADILPSL
jgi:hypothetical protein